MKMINYPKTKQFRDVVRDISHYSTYMGEDENGQPIFDNTAVKPKIRFRGSVKLHGTNAAVSYDGKNLWVQSRNRVITSLTGHMGFAEFVHNNKEWIKNVLDEYRVDDATVTMYGEWVGPSIQSGVAISELPEKMWFVFGVKVSSDTYGVFWKEDFEIPKDNNRIHSVWDMPTFEMDIDFAKPDLAVNELVKITEEVEKECPVAKQFGISGVGEGVVWVGWYDDNRFIFKVKGEKHSSSKVKKLAQVDPEKMQNIYDFVDYAATANRVDQAMQEVSDGDVKSLTRKNTPDILRWIAGDIISEEGDVLQENGLEWKNVAKGVSDRARKIYFNKLDKIL